MNFHVCKNILNKLELLAEQGSNASLTLPLQCPSCPGPVLLPCDEDQGGLFYNEEAIIAGTGQCLLCSRPLPGVREQVMKAETARKALHLIARLINGVIVDEAKRQYYLEKMVCALELVVTTVYQKSLLLLEDIYAVCKELHRADGDHQFEEIVLFYGRLVDKMLPLDGPKLLALGKVASSREQLFNSGTGTPLPFTDVFDVNIEHLLFWTDGVFGKKNPKNGNSVPVVIDADGVEKEDKDSWQAITGARFAYRLEKALQMVIGEKQRQLLPPDLEHSQQDYASFCLKEEIFLLKALAKEKAIQVDEVVHLEKF